MDTKKDDAGLDGFGDTLDDICNVRQQGFVDASCGPQAPPAQPAQPVKPQVP